MRSLGLHQMSAMDVSAPELVSIAAEVGCQFVCVFVNVDNTLLPEEVVRDVLRRFPRVTEANKGEMMRRMADTGVAVGNVEFFPIIPDVSIGGYLPALDLSADLGAHRVVTHVYDPNDERAATNLARLADLAAERGMEVGLEFMAMSPACDSFARGVDIVRRTGKANVGVGVDFLHLIRTAGTAAQLAATPRELIGYAQLCDGPDLLVSRDYTSEAVDRLSPGDGCFPIADILDALPADAALDVEVPSLGAQQKGVPALTRVRQAVVASRGFVDARSSMKWNLNVTAIQSNCRVPAQRDNCQGGSHI